MKPSREMIFQQSMTFSHRIPVPPPSVMGPGVVHRGRSKPVGAIRWCRHKTRKKPSPSPSWPMKASTDGPPSCPPRPGPAIPAPWGKSAGRRLVAGMVSMRVVRGKRRGRAAHRGAVRRVEVTAGDSEPVYALRDDRVDTLNREGAPSTSPSGWRNGCVSPSEGVDWHRRQTSQIRNPRLNINTPG